MSQEDLFIQHFVERKGKENDLSDILFALFNSNESFNEKFIELVKSKASDSDSIKSFGSIIYAEREVFYGENGRPDLVLNIGHDKKVLLEVKINDPDPHEVKYNKILADKSNQVCSIILLTKERLSPQRYDGWIKITWGDIINILNELSATNLILELTNKYLKRALEMNEIKEVNFEEKSISTLLYFNRMLLRSTESLKNDVMQAKKYSSPVEDDGVGYYFEIELKQNVSIYPWFGINFNEIHGVGIMIWMQKHSHKNYFPQIISYLKKMNLATDKVGPSGQYYISKKEDDIVYMMKGDEFKETFMSNGIIEKEKQQNKLNDFLLGFVKTIKNALEISD